MTIMTMMLEPELLTPDQDAAIDRLYTYDNTLLYAKMGAGKTVIALSAISDLLRHGVCSRILVIAPLSVCKTVWANEHERWQHLKHLDVRVAAGGSDQKRRDVIFSECDVVVINFENVRWFFAQMGKTHGFDGLLIDELSKLKDPGSKVFKKLRRHVKDFSWRVGMTGTPVSEHWQGLYSQCMCLDDGAALGTRKDRFMRKYFYPTDYQEYNWELKPGADKQIMARVHSLFHSVEDYRHELPPLHEHVVEVELPKQSREAYNELLRHSVLELEGGEKIIAANAAVLVGKLQQIANGFLYFDDDGKQGVAMHREKHARIFQIWKALENRPVVIVYAFTYDCYRIMQDMHSWGVPAVKLETQKNLAETVEKWNAGEIPVLLMHPKSAGHGLNLAKGGSDIIFVGPIWSRDQTTQVIARLWRRGQKNPVNVTHVIAKDTVDALIMERVEGKGTYETLLDSHI